MAMQALKEFFWYTWITTMVVIAMYVADIPWYLSNVFSYYGMFKAFDASERIRQQGLSHE